MPSAQPPLRFTNRHSGSAASIWRTRRLAPSVLTCFRNLRMHTSSQHLTIGLGVSGCRPNGISTNRRWYCSQSWRTAQLINLPSMRNEHQWQTANRILFRFGTKRSNGENHACDPWIHSRGQARLGASYSRVKHSDI